MTWTFRDATLADVPALTTLVNRAYRVEDFFKFGDRTDADDVRERLAGGRFILVEAPDGTLAGSVYFEIRDGRGYFGMLSAEPALKGSGLGRKLICAAENAARAAGCTEMKLSVVNVREELIPWYERLGYAAYGTEPWPASEPTRIPVHFILMSRPLPAEPPTKETRP